MGGRDMGIEEKPMANAIPAGEAARIILAGVAHREGIIVLSELARNLWLQYRMSPEAGEKFLREMAAQRRRSSESKGSDY